MGVVVVTGPPCSGKTTYVRANAAPGDVVIDFDDLARALGSPVHHGHSDAIREVTQAARRSAVKAALRLSRVAQVWIVDGALRPESMRAYSEVRATIVVLSEPAEVLHARAEAERPPLWHQLIDAWGH